MTMCWDCCVYARTNSQSWCAGVQLPANRPSPVWSQPRGRAGNGAGGKDPSADTCPVANPLRQRWVAPSLAFLPGP